ncbi:hypothetical protein M433DRAFT_291330 [Acidomyces richmondensis BFW]|nr:MAG: hypothetical protein FE78DRAFT_469494 [Acidomyces sp. 'richmondensis']KYG49548.1 hypothetical protein M433DRAFT_291330 [Acidomyces richmondensis BFW]
MDDRISGRKRRKTIFFSFCTIPLAVGVATGLALYRIARQSLKPRYAVALASVSLLLWLVQIMVIFFVYSNWEPCATEDTSWEWNIVGNWANIIFRLGFVPFVALIYACYLCVASWILHRVHKRKKDEQGNELDDLDVPYAAIEDTSPLRPKPTSHDMLAS